jgi:hypothetical protein
MPLMPTSETMIPWSNNPPDAFSRRRWSVIGVALVGVCAGIAVASWLKGDLPRNDFERFDDLRLSFLFFALFAGLATTYLAAYGQRAAVGTRTVAGVALAAALLLWVSFPVGSKDVIGYAFYGRILGHYNQNPYVATPADFPDDAWQPFVQVRWRDQPMVYGPLFVWQSAPVDALAGASLWTAVWLHKALAVVWLMIGLGIGSSLLRRTENDTGMPWSWLVVLLAWNPLLLFEAACGGHNDVAMMTLLLAALLGWQAGRPALGLALLALSFWFKWYGLLFVPAFLIATHKSFGWRALVISAASGGAVAVLVGVITLLPLPDSFGPLLQGVLHPGALRGIFPNELSPPLALLFWGLDVAGSFDTDLGQRLFDAARFALFALTVTLTLWRQWRAAPSFAALVESCCLLGSAFFLLLVTMLLPWHLLTVVALAVLRGRQPWLAWAVVLTVLALASYFLTFAVATLGAAVVAAAVWLLRRSRVPLLTKEGSGEV